MGKGQESQAWLCISHSEFNHRRRKTQYCVWVPALEKTVGLWGRKVRKNLRKNNWVVCFLLDFGS